MARQPRPLVVAYGMGVDSTAVLVEFARRKIMPGLVLFADTGSEKPETYAYLPTIQRFLKANGMPPVEVVRYVLNNPGKRDEQGNLIWYKTLEEECRRHHHLPALAYGMKDCSLKWKRQPQHKRVESWQPAIDAWARGQRVTVMIGYDAGPADSRRHMHIDDERYEYWHPLREWGWDRERCKSEIRRAKLEVPVKSACFFCPAAQSHEITWLTRNHPELADRAVAMEACARRGLTSSQGLWRSGGRCKPPTMTEWIRLVRDADASGRGKRYPARSEESTEAGSYCAVDGIEDVAGGCLGF